jgi:hypothetical protein
MHVKGTKNGVKYVGKGLFLRRRPKISYKSSQSTILTIKKHSLLSKIGYPPIPFLLEKG